MGEYQNPGRPASAAPEREISVSAAVALAQAATHLPDAGQDQLTPGCRCAGTLRPPDTYWFTGRSVGSDGKYMTMEVHRVIVVWGPRLDTTFDIFGRDLIRFWIWDPATGNEGSATFGPRGVVRTNLDSQYRVPAPGAPAPPEVRVRHLPTRPGRRPSPGLPVHHLPARQMGAPELPGRTNEGKPLTERQAGAPEKIRITEPDWYMGDWPAEEITVAGIVTPLEGCGSNDDPAAVVDAYGREIAIIGVRWTGSRVELVVDTEGPAR